MGRPMAANLLRAGIPLTVYNRSRAAADPLEALGAKVAPDPDALFAASDVVLLMLADDTATDAVLDRRGSAFHSRVAGRLIVNLGTHAPDYSRDLERDIHEAGGRFVEAPVSGSRGPAESGRLVCMAAGDPQVIAELDAVLTAMCREVVVVGPVPSAMAMKLAVNLYLVAGVAALAEAVGLARRLELDLEVFRRVIQGGPMCSAVAMAKLDKMLRRDFAPEAAIRDVCKNADLIARTAAEVAEPTPLLLESLRLFRAAFDAGGGDLDMAAVEALAQAGPHG